MEVKRWIDCDESAAEMLARVSTERPFLLLPPLHRLPLRVGNVVELVGPSPSAKTTILIQAAISCILPKEWNGVHYGGLGRLAMFIDLDCRFDVLCLSEMLRNRIMEANGLISKTNLEQDDIDIGLRDRRGKSDTAFVEELHALCMRRFLYIRCYDSIEFLASLKTLHLQLNKLKESHKSTTYLLMIDSIGAFHWIDRASTVALSGNTNRKNFSLQSVSETVVQEIRKLLLVHPMVVICTKAISLGDRYSSNEVQWKRSFPNADFQKVTSSSHKLPYREYMPYVWQSFVTHRILVRASDESFTVRNHQSCAVFLSEWLLPPLGVLDRFIVKNQSEFWVSENPVLYHNSYYLSDARRFMALIIKLVILSLQYMSMDPN